MELQPIKPPTTYAQQIEMLRLRGCEIPDEQEQECLRLLSRINYYRLTAYFLPFRKADNSYVPETTLITVFNIYEFDRKMRHLIFNALEEVEVHLRTCIAYFHAHKYGSDGYLKASSFKERHDHVRFENNIKREKELNSHLPFVQHHINVYSGTLPLWALVELFPFGMLVNFYKDMKTPDRKHIAAKFESTDSLLRSWLRCSTNLRNTCAHYGRLYYQKFTATPAEPNDFSMDENSKTRLFGAVFALKKIYPDKDKWNREFIPQMVALIEEYNDYVELSHIGFMSDWEQKLSN